MTRSTHDVLSSHLRLRQAGRLNWSARRADTQVHDGSDTYVVHDGRIRMQSIHYSVRED